MTIYTLNRRTTMRRMATGLMLSAMLTACGYKGPLYLPKAEAISSASTTQAVPIPKPAPVGESAL